MQHEQLLKAQQNSLLVCHQHNDSVIQNIAELQSVNCQQPQRSSHTSKRHKTARTNGKSVPYVTEVEKKLVSTTRRSDTHSTVDTVSSQAPTVCQPLTLQPTASVHRSVSSFDYKAEPFSHRMTRDVSGHAANSVSPRTANLVNDSIGTQSRQSGSLPLKPAAVKNISARDTCEVDYNSSAKRSATVSDFSGSNLPVHSLATESAELLAYMPPLTVTVTNTYSPVLSSPARSPRYFERLGVLPVSEASAIGLHDLSTSASLVQTCSSGSVPLTKPNCVFASKSMIATTYLSRRPPMFSPVCVENRSDSDDGSHADRNSAQSDSSTAAETAERAASPPTKLSDDKQNSFAKLSVTSVASPEVPPRLSRNQASQSMSRLSSSKLHKALYVDNPQVSQTALLSDISNSGGLSSSANSTENFCAGSPLADEGVLPNSDVSAVVADPSPFVPFNTIPATDVSSMFSSVCSSKVPFNGTVSPALLLSDLSAPLSVCVASEKPETTSVVTSCPVPRVSASLSDVMDRLSSSVVSPSFNNTSQSTAVVDVNASSDITEFLQPGQQHESMKLLTNIPPALTVPSVRYAMPCTLTISTHIPASSPSIDALTSSLHTTLSGVANYAVAAGSSCDSSRLCSTTAAVDILNTSIPSSSSLSRSSESSCKLTETTSGEVSDHSLSQSEMTTKQSADEQPADLPDASHLYTSSPRRLYSDGTRVSHVSSPPSHAASDSLEQTDIATVVDNTAEEHSMDKRLSLDVIAAEFNETEADTSSDDASSDIVPLEGEPDPVPVVHTLVSKQKQNSGSRALQRVSFSPLALLLDASLEGDLELVMNTAKKVCCKLFATKPIC